MDTVTEPLHSVGVVLAGGRSSRMGRDKAMLSWHGQPLIEHQIDLLKAAGVDVVHVSGDRPDYAGIVDVVSHAGPVGGIAGIAAVVNDAELLIIPVDMPRLQPSLLRRLRTESAPSRCAHFSGHVLPMRLRLDATCRAVLATLMAAQDDRARSLRALQERVGVSAIPLHDDEAAQLIDCNTEETWREVCE
ncbi:molybdenum cofactor guanylyltransferase [Dyella psychrodurans]|uniref:Molybdenum cofactor guanylyltransferase n=1 Tax=Dyella psychrodurans TaxID=1927960 RepID=A0A370WY02_9GAMM|nr:molybdenum cofactor guanylyltransferase [Dyella psychrodurans]RDS81024.1 molybdenum cofactor guanylyltransferase [Dyella psychrodurans]